MAEKQQVIYWKPYNNEVIVSRFSERDWHSIHSDISNDKELQKLFQLEFFHGYVAYNKEKKPVAFALLIEEAWRGNQVQVHGGCWSGSVWDSYAAMITLIETLFEKGKAVRSQCKLDNIRTTRFLQSLGFVNHYTSNRFRYYWLPYKRFVNSKIYKRFKI